MTSIIAYLVAMQKEIKVLTELETLIADAKTRESEMVSARAIKAKTQEALDELA